ncbi:NUDIX hydrolase [Deinococcus sp. SM5_A1]|uniref:NUDIX hydrolase n=1 Tax=Deinococcus sp. SM5_A1 TaxID=3379094 RepID=UPI00385ACB53
MSDVRMRLDQTVFALRAGVVCVRDDQALVISGDWFDFRYLPGGNVAVGEDTAASAAREFEEEAGVKAGPLRLLAVMEHFFELNGESWHQVGFYYRMDAPSQVPDGPFRQRDDARVVMDWVPIQQMNQLRVMPPGLQEALLTP